MQINYSTRVTVGTTILLLFALLANYQLVTGWVESDLSFIGRDYVTEFEKRFAPVKANLPEHAVVGFTVVGHADDSDEGLRQRYLTQYTLAPRLIAKGGATQEFLLQVSPAGAGTPVAEESTVKKYEGGPTVFTFGNGISLTVNER